MSPGFVPPPPGRVPPASGGPAICCTRMEAVKRCALGDVRVTAGARASAPCRPCHAADAVKSWALGDVRVTAMARVRQRPAAPAMPQMQCSRHAVAQRAVTGTYRHTAHSAGPHRH